MTALRLAGAWSRLQFCASLVPPDLWPPEASQICERADAVALTTALGRYGSGLDGVAWAQATLPVRLGGLGIQSVSAEVPGLFEATAAVLVAIDAGEGLRAAELVRQRKTDRCERARATLA
ncbi:MAG: hypothetical protein ACK56F_04970, partial [bacterium]